VKFWLRVEKEE